MKNLSVLLVLLVLVHHTSFSQEEIVCPWVTTIFKIQQESDIPNITTNSDGTLTITHPTNEAITSIFSNYKVTVLERAFPSAQSEELIKAYIVSANSKQLFADLRDNVSETIYSDFESIGPHTFINTDFINLVDGNEYRLSAAISTTDFDPCSINCDPEPLGDDINIILRFMYNPDEDVLQIETTQDTSCGNSFSVSLSGGADFGDPLFNDLYLQTWSVNSATINTQDFDESCFEPEYILYDLLQMICVLRL